MSARVFMDGTGITPGTEKCKCGSKCEFPCWQRLGWAPACEACGCPALPDDEQAAPEGEDPQADREKVS